MKTITPYLLRFALAAALLTIIYRYFLSYGLEIQSGTVVTLSAIIYIILMFVSGLFFGKKDGEYLPIFDVGFRFHFTTYIVHIGISLLWIGLGFGSKNEHFDLPVMIAFYWGIILLLHFIFYLWARKNSINNLDKEDIFD